MIRAEKSARIGIHLVAVACIFLLLGLVGCPGTVSLTTVGTLAGNVTNSLTGSGIANAIVTLDPEVEGVEIITGARGTYRQQLPAGIYTLIFEDDQRGCRRGDERGRGPYAD